MNEGTIKVLKDKFKSFAEDLEALYIEAERLEKIERDVDRKLEICRQQKRGLFKEKEVSKAKSKQFTSKVESFNEEKAEFEKEKRIFSARETKIDQRMAELKDQEREVTDQITKLDSVIEKKEDLDEREEKAVKKEIAIKRKEGLIAKEKIILREKRHKLNVLEANLKKKQVKLQKHLELTDA